MDSANVPLNEVLQYGKAPNTDPSSTPNATVEEAKQMQAYMKSLIGAVNGGVVGNIVINTTIPTGSAAHLIPLQNVSPQPPDSAMLYLHVEISSAAVPLRQYNVASWLRSVKFNGLENATRQFLTMLDPEFSYLNVPEVKKTLDETLNSMYTTAL